MMGRLEQLLCGLRERQLTSADRDELLSLVRGSEALCRLAARDRIIDRLLRESHRAPLSADLVLKAIARGPSDLPDKTMAELNQCPAPGVPVIVRGWEKLNWLWLMLTGDRSKAWRIALGVALIAITAGIFWFGKQPQPQVILGQFTATVGEPIVRHTGQRSTLNAQRSTPVHLGDRIETGDGDRAEVQFNDGTTLRLHFNTVVEVQSSKFKVQSSEATLQRPSEILLLRGQIWTKVQTLTNAPQYAVRTPVATAIARGTEFGVKLQRSPAATNAQTGNSKPETNLLAVLTVKEGAVDFTNALGTVRATAMTESTAGASSAPTEPKRLQTLQVVQLAPGSTWSLVSSPLALPDAAEKLAGGGGWAGLKLRDFAIGLALTNAATPGTSNEVRVAQVFQASPAGRAGMKAGDVLLAFEGRPVTNAIQVEQTILLRPNSDTTLKLRRGGEEQIASLIITNQAGIQPGPTLSTGQRAQLANLTREFVEGGNHPKPGARLVGEPGSAGIPAGENSSVKDRRYKAVARVAGPKTLQAAAQNNLGVIFESEDALGAAIRAYNRASCIAPEVPLYHFNLGLALRKIGSFERAEEEFEAAARLAPASTEPRKWLASTRSLLGRHQEALTETEAALVVAPSDHSLWELKAQLLNVTGRFTNALEAARKAVELDAGCATAHGYLAVAFHRLGNLREAETSYQRALELAPFDALHHMDLGVVLRSRGQFASAEQRLRRAIELRPDLIVAYENLGLLYASTRREAQAEETFLKALKVDPDNVEILRKLIYLTAENGRLDEAETRARKVLELAPHDSGSHNDLGEVLRQKGKFDEAIQSYRKALELRPDSPGVLNNIAIIHAMRGQFAEAEKTFRTLIDLAAKDRRIYPLNFLINLAMVCDKQGKLEDGEKFYRQALALEPNDPGICNSLAWFLADHQLKLDEALTLVRRAIQAAPNDPNFLDTLGWVHFQREELDEAEKAFTAALELAPQHPSAPKISEHLKKVQEKKGAVKK